MQLRPPLALALGLSLAAAAAATPAGAATLLVPAQLATIQAAIDAAVSGDVIEIAPGAYVQSLSIPAKTLTLRSLFATSGDPADIEATVIDGGGADVVVLASGANVLMQGLSLRNGSGGIRVNAGATLVFEDGRVRGTSDGISLEGGTASIPGIARATIRRSLLEANSDDGLDSDNRGKFVVEDSVLQNNGDDGIEIRLHNNDFGGASVEHVIARNRITGNGEDGIQLIDYDQLTARSFRIERNVIASNADAGLGMMCNGNSIENFEGCPIPEPVRLAHNTFLGNNHGLSGGVNTIGVGNLFVGSTLLGVKNVTGGSLLAHSLFHANGTNAASSNLDLPTTLFADPLLSPSQRPQAGSPAIDAGVAFYMHQGEVIVDLDPSEYDGSAPDLGALEHDPNAPPSVNALDVRIATGSDDAEETGSGSMSLTHGDLGFGNVATVEWVGMRFPGLAIPPGAPILAAGVQLRADESDSGPTLLTLQGQDADDAPVFGTGTGNISSRPRTGAVVVWSPLAWSLGGAGPAQQTPDLSEIVQAIVDRPGWASGNALVLIVNGDGERVAESTEGLAAMAPLLHVEWQTTACADGVDQDGDGAADFPADPGCSSPTSDIEDPACQDGENNDLQPGIDYDGGAAANGGVPLDAPDPDCSVPWTRSESRINPPGCGLGGELIVPLGLLAWARAGRRGAIAPCIRPM